MAAYWEIAAHSAYDMFSKYTMWDCILNCQFSFSQHGFWSGNFFVIAPFPDHCLLLLFYSVVLKQHGAYMKKIIYMCITDFQYKISV